MRTPPNLGQNPLKQKISIRGQNMGYSAAGPGSHLHWCPKNEIWERDLKVSNLCQSKPNENQNKKGKKATHQK